MNMLSNPAIKAHVAILLNDIAGLSPQLKDLRDSLARDNGQPFRLYSADDWAKYVFRYALQRVLIFGERNFNNVETLNLLALTRYLFELLVWVRLIGMDRQYGLVYYAQQIYTMKRFYKDQIEHFTREAQLLKKFGQSESEQMDENLSCVLAELDGQKRLAGAAAFSAFSRQVMRDIDAEAAKHFSVYADDARINGYGFQAYFIETETIRLAQDALTQLEASGADFRQRVPQATLDLIPKGNNWNWRQMAVKVGMEHEYDFIYTYTSKLLHATPASITTDNPNLELIEVRTFLRYILVTIREMIRTIRTVEDQHL